MDTGFSARANTRRGVLRGAEVRFEVGATSVAGSARGRGGAALACALAFVCSPGLLGCSDSGGVTGAGPGFMTDEGSESESTSMGTEGETTAGPATDATPTETSGTAPTVSATDTTGASDPSDASSEPVDPLSFDCDGLPGGAVGASYEYTLSGAGGVQPYSWAVEGLPAGLTVEEQTGYIAGTPTESGEFDLQVTLTDWNDAAAMDTCSLVIDDAFSVDLDGLPKPCLSKEETILSFITGGNGEPITCSVPGGKGNGKLPEGLAIDPDDCTIQGAITELNYGTWAWIVEAKQGESSVFAPYCATQDLQLPQSYPISVTHAGGDELVPASGKFTPGEPVKFDGDSEPLFQIPGCGGPPCYHETIVQFTSSPFGSGECQDDADGCFGICPLEPDNQEPDGDKQQACALLDGFLGLEHELWAKGAAVGPAFEDRPWIAHHTLHYCMGDTPEHCEGGLEVIQENGNNTNLEFSVIMWPE